MKTYTIKTVPTLGVVALRFEPDCGAVALVPSKRLTAGMVFDYGYNNSGARSLAAVILYDAFYDAAPDAGLLASDNAEDFALEFLGSSKRGKLEFRITQRQILSWLSKRTSTGVR